MESLTNEWQHRGNYIDTSDVVVHTISRENLALHEISKEQSEFQRAAFQFFTFTKYPIECVQRVDVIQYGAESEVRKKYDICKQEFATQGESIVEVLVFHGTPNLQNVQNIMTHGFKVGGVDVKLAHGAAYGAGVYTAIGPATAQQYAQGTNAIILAKGLRGRIGANGDTTAHSINANHDWIVFRRACQLLPLYVVYFNPVLPAGHTQLHGFGPMHARLKSSAPGIIRTSVKHRPPKVAPPKVAPPKVVSEEAKEEADFKAAVTASLVSLKSPRVPKQSELEAEEKALEQAKLASAAEFSKHQQKEHLLLQQAVQRSLRSISPILIDDDTMDKEEEEWIKHATAASIKDSRAVEAKLAQQEREERDLDAAITQSILSASHYIDSSQLRELSPHDESMPSFSADTSTCGSHVKSPCHVMFGTGLNRKRYRVRVCDDGTLPRACDNNVDEFSDDANDGGFGGVYESRAVRRQRSRLAASKKEVEVVDLTS